MAESDDTDLIQDLEGPVVDDAARTEPSERTYEDPRRALSDEALRSVLARDILKQAAARRIRAIVIIAPTNQWLAWLRHAAQIRFNSATVTSYPGQLKGKRVESDDHAAGKLALGGLVVGIATTTAHLPPALVAAADVKLTIPVVDTALIKRVARRCLRGRPSPAFNGLPPVAGLDFDEICACLPAGTAVSLAARKLRTAIHTKLSAPAAKKNLPALEDAAGYGDALEWGLDLKRDIEDLRVGKIGWSDINHGVVLFGPPGTGKTQFGHILGKACGLPIIATSVADLFGMSAGYLDSVIKELRVVFDRARASAPCLLFLDELDAVPNRATLSPRGKDWWAPVVTDFLLQLDSAVSSRNGVIVIGATNRIEDIDAAILRPGRLERAIYVGPPTPEDLVRILRHHLGDDLVGDDLTKIAYARWGATGAEAMEWVRGARRNARKAGRKMVYDDLAAVALPKDQPTLEDLRRTAIHEAGHAVVHMVSGVGAVERIVLVDSTESHGHTVWSPGKTTALTRKRLEGMIVGVLGGRAADATFYDDVVAGAGGGEDSDLARATALAAAWHTSFGLGDTLLWTNAPEDALSQIALDRSLRAKVESDLQRLFARAMALVDENRDAVAAVAEALVKKGVLLHDEIEQVMGTNNLRPVSGRGRFD